MSYYDYTYFIIVKFIMINKYILIVNINWINNIFVASRIVLRI
jgi:hypothetical protein